MFKKLVSTFYDRKGNSISLHEWHKKLKISGYKHIRYTDLESGNRVITTWLGLDHSFSSGNPLFFQTMVFSNIFEDLDCNRYESEEEAIIGHSAMVEKWNHKNT